MPVNITSKNVMLDALDESNSQVTHIGVATLAGGAPGMGVNAGGVEVSGGSPAYARVPVTWGAASAVTAEQKLNTGALSIDVPAGTYAYLLGFNASTGNTNNYRAYWPMGGGAALRGFGTVDTTLTNDAIFSAGHGMADGDRVLLYAPFTDALPTGLTEEVLYYVVGSATNSFKVSATLGGSPVDITAVGGGELFWQRCVPETFAAQGLINVPIGALVLDNSTI